LHSFIFALELQTFMYPFSSSSFMFPVAGGLGPPQGTYELNILSTKFFALFRYAKQLKIVPH